MKRWRQETALLKKFMKKALQELEGMVFFSKGRWKIRVKFGYRVHLLF